MVTDRFGLQPRRSVAHVGAAEHLRVRIQDLAVQARLRDAQAIADAAAPA